MLKNYQKKLCHVNILTAIAFLFATIAANTTCMCLYHQEEFPEDVKSLRKLK